MAKHRTLASAVGTALGLAGASNAAAQIRWPNRFWDDDDGTDIASAGNAGVATASANGGAVSIGNVNSGGNACNAIGIGDTYGGVVPVDPIVYGGDCVNATAIDVTAIGGTAIADASGGDYNIAFVS